MIAHSIFFYFFSTIAVISAIMLTVSKNTVHSVFFCYNKFSGKFKFQNQNFVRGPFKTPGKSNPTFQKK